MFRTKRQIGVLAFCFLTLIVISLVVGCSGGSSGTGGQAVLGKVLDAGTLNPVPDVSVTVLETGGTSNSGPAGDYEIITSISGDSLEFLLETESFSATVVVSGLPPEVKTVVVDFLIDQPANQASSNLIAVETGTQGGSAGGANSNESGSENENSSGSGSSGSNENESEGASGNENSGTNENVSVGGGNENSGQGSGGENENSGGESVNGNENSGGNSGPGGGDNDNDDDDDNDNDNDNDDNENDD